jgi:hypothetical protein
MRIKNNYPLFLPNVTKTYTDIANVLKDGNVRLIEARKALFSIIEKGYFDKIVIVDGSNQEVLSKTEIEDFGNLGIVIEQLLFQQNVEEVKCFGKSQGEMQITNYMVKKSILVKEAGGFTKISPRYIINNIDFMMKLIHNRANVFFFYHPPIIRKLKPYVCTIFYKTSLDFYEKYLKDSIKDCNEQKSDFLESVFFRRLINLKKVSIFVPFPLFSGVAGTTGKGIYNGYFILRNMLAKTGLMCYSFKE